MLQILKLAGGIVAIGVFIVMFGPKGGGGEETAEASAKPVVRSMSASSGGAKFQSVAPRD